jgi:hypothetical protein
MLRLGERFSLSGCEVEVDEFRALIPTGKARVALLDPPINRAHGRRT